MHKVINFVLFQCVWLGAVVGVGGYGLHVLLVLALGALVIHLAFMPGLQANLLTGVLALCVGTMIDLVWVMMDILAYPRDQLVPYWIGVLWFSLGASLNYSFAVFKDLAWKGAAIVGVFAPVTYLTGERFGAVEVVSLYETGWICIAWFVVFFGLSSFFNWLNNADIVERA